MDRNQKSVYCFIYDDTKEFYRATQTPKGDWVISHNSQMYPLRNNPKNLIDTPVEFSTNKAYFSMPRSINYPLEFTFDGAAILNYKYELGKGISENLYLAIFEFDPADGIYRLSFSGRFDFQQKKRDHKVATFTVPIVDDSAWGILSQNDDVEYSIDCSENNPKAVKVLFDNFTLQNRYTYQTVQAPITRIAAANSFVIPFVLVNQDGDSFGLVTKSQTGDSSPNQTVSGPLAGGDYVVTSLNNFLYSFYNINGVNIQGSIQFTWSILHSGVSPMYIFFRSSTGQSQIVFQLLAGSLIVGQTYNIPFNFNWNLVPGEKVFFMMQLNAAALDHMTITPIVTNIFVTTLTKAPSTICYGLRPLDLLKALVEKGTLERYTIDSDFFTVNNKTVLIPGEQFRGIRDSKIYSSFKDFFQTFSPLFFMALRNVNGSLFMELADEVYKPGVNIIDLGDLIEFETSPAIEYFANEIEVGSPKQDYRHPSGRLEFNSTNTFSLPFTNIKNKLSLVTKYRTDCYGMIFLMLDYNSSSTKDNSGDKDVFVVDITDEVGSAAQNIETFENINVDDAPLAPIIKYPLTGEIINSAIPFLKGIGIVGTNVNIYTNGALDGGTVVDGAGNWSYQIVNPLPSYDPGVFDGIAVIQATNTDLSAANDTIQLLIDTTVAGQTGITYPKFNDSLYNNLPLVRGVAPAGTNINISLDGIFLAAVVADNSCKFEYKIVVPITNGNHTLDIGGGLTNFNVSAFTRYPLITYIGSELDGFPLVNNLPLIKGVGVPGETVTLWLNYVSYASLGTSLIDAFGDWSFQVVPVTYPDPLSGLPIVLSPIRNGLSIVSTLLINNFVPINVSGFKLNRPAYDSITGVLDNTVFNTRLSPMHQMMNHKSLLASIMNRQKGDFIEAQKQDKNGNLRTVLGSAVFYERANISPSSLGNPLATLEIAKIKADARRTFAKTLYDFSNGGTVTAKWKGKDVFMLPIGDMKMKSIMDDVQDWNLLISPQTTYSQLLNFYKNGLTINLMQNAFFHSDSNSLHFVEYNYAQPSKYNFKSIYTDWFINRNDQWSEKANINYIQKYQKAQILRDQIITNGIGAMTLRMYNCKGPELVATFNYDPVVVAPIPLPEIVKEAVIDLSVYPEGQYFFVQMIADVMVAISERIETRVNWKRTILIESSNSINKPGVFYSTGFKTIICIEGLVKKLQPNIDTFVAKEESGNQKLLWSQLAKKRMIRYGDARGFPDYLAIKMADSLTNDLCLVEGTYYTMEEGEKINPSEDIPGVPMYYYEVMMALKENSKGKVFPGDPGADVGGVTIVVDASAIGLPAHSLIDITEG